MFYLRARPDVILEWVDLFRLWLGRIPVSLLFFHAYSKVVVRDFRHKAVVEIPDGQPMLTLLLAPLHHQEPDDPCLNYNSHPPSDVSQGDQPPHGLR